MRNNGLIGQIAAFALFVAIPVSATAQDEGCDVLDVPNPYLNAQFCARLKALTDSRAVPPTRSATTLEPEIQELIENVGLVQKAYEADPKKALELIKRIREAGGLTN